MKINKTSTTIDISHRSIVFTVLLLIGIYLLYLIADIVIMLFIAILFTAALNPLVTKLEQRKIPRALSILITYLLIFGVIAILILSILPPLISESNSLIRQIKIPPELFQNFRLTSISVEHLQIIANQFTSVPKLIALVSSAFSSVIILLTLLVISFYMLMERRNLHKYLMWFFGNNAAEKKAEKFVNTFEHKIGGWVGGEILLMCAVGLLTYIGLSLLGIPFALPLAILAGVLELLPNIGPTIAAIPAILVALLTVSPGMALAILALYIIIQQVENNLLMPYAMKKAANINPIISILVILIGFKLGGVIGAALAIPTFLAVKLVATEWYQLKNPNLSNK